MHKEFYRVMLQSGRDVPASVLRDAWRESSKDSDMLVTLMRRGDLPQDLILKGSQSRRLEVRAAYYSRSGATPEKLEQLRGEGAQGALSIVAERLDASPEVLDVLADVGNATVCATTLVHKNATSATRRKALIRLDEQYAALSSPKRTYVNDVLSHNKGTRVEGGQTPLVLTDMDLLGRVLSNVELDPDDTESLCRTGVERWGEVDDKSGLLEKLCLSRAGCQEEVGKSASQPRILLPLDLDKLSDETLGRVAKVMLEDLKSGRSQHAAQWFERYAKTLMRTQEGQGILLQLTAIDFPAQSSWTYYPLVYSVLAQGLGERVLAGDPSPSVRRLATSVVSSDAEELLALMHENDHNIMQVLPRTLLRNPNLPGVVAQELVRSRPMHEPQLRIITNRFKEDVETLAHVVAYSDMDLGFLRDNPLAEAVVYRGVVLMAEERVTNGGASRALRGRRPLDQHVYRLNTIMNQKVVPGGALGMVDEYVRNQDAKLILENNPPALLAWRAGVLLGEALGDDQRRWESYKVLAEGCEVSFGSLLEGAVAISG